MSHTLNDQAKSIIDEKELRFKKEVSKRLAIPNTFTSELTKKSNTHFIIKCTWDQPSPKGPISISTHNEIAT